MKPATVTAVRERLAHCVHTLEVEQTLLANAETEVAARKKAIAELQADIADLEGDLPPAALKGGAYQQQANEVKAGERKADTKASAKGDAK